MSLRRYRIDLPTRLLRGGRLLLIGLLLALGIVWLTGEQVRAESEAELARATEFRERVQPLLERYCHGCHAGDLVEAEVDLAAFTTLADLQRQPRLWLRIRSMLESGQMPPKEANQPTDEERRWLQNWVRAFLTREAEAQAGDPGPLLLRRLNNEEYNYTIRDLTGVDSLDPTSEFPVDGAAGEGFINTGAGQAMSPALVTKYLDAAKAVASHVVLLPNGIRFSPATTRRDQTDEMLGRIQAFYRQFTEDGGGATVNLQGIQFNTNQGGLLPIKRYFAALLEERQAIHAGQKTVAQVAQARNLSPRYLDTLWNQLESPQAKPASWLLSTLRQKWQQASPTEVESLVAWVGETQKTLWKFNSVGQLTEGGKQKVWMEPVSPLIKQQELRISLTKDFLQARRAATASPSSPATAAPQLANSQPQQPSPMPMPTGGSSASEAMLAGSRSGEMVVYLTAQGLEAGGKEALVVWQRPRLEYPAAADGSVHPPLLLRDLPGLIPRIEQTIQAEIPRTVRYLEALASAPHMGLSFEELASKTALDATLLKRWSELVGLGLELPRDIRGHFTAKLTQAQGYADVNGWGTPQTPNLLTNRSRAAIQFLTLTVPARGVVVHPSPAEESLVIWRSPMKGAIRIDARVADADDKCGNGLAYRLELVAESGRSVLAEGVLNSGGQQAIQLDQKYEIAEGDLVQFVINARDRNHACDTTHVELTLREQGGAERKWDLATDVVDRILESNPLPDAYGQEGVWHFCASGASSPPPSKIVPGSALAEWRAGVKQNSSLADLRKLAERVQEVLTTPYRGSLSKADQEQGRMINDWRGPLQWTTLALQRGVQTATTPPAKADSQSSVKSQAESKNATINNTTNTTTINKANNTTTTQATQTTSPVEADAATATAKLAANAGVFPMLPGDFGKHPGGAVIDDASLCRAAPHQLELRLPAELAEGADLVMSVALHASSQPAAGVQVSLEKRAMESPSWRPSLPILVGPSGEAAADLEAALADFRNVFPPALCYARIVPVDEVVTMTLFFREDEMLQRLMLNETQIAELNRLWDELFYVAQEPIALTVAFEQIYEFATQDRPDLVKAFGPMRAPINERAERFRQRLVATEPAHLEAVLKFADRAWRRPLSSAEQDGLRDFYQQMRQADIEHDKAITLSVARVLASPSFLYRREEPPAGTVPQPVTQLELASRLSYFLWSSLPDDELRGLAEAGQLASDEVLLAQTHRMLRDPKIRRLAIQFACQWLHLRDFDDNDEKNEQLFPEFASLRGPMYEEVICFFEAMFREDRSILELVDADHTFLNESLARHYGVPGIAGEAWQRVEGMRARGRGGILGMGAFLASQSAASRTSPILRGNWVYETLLGERLPRPPANVPQLPESVPTGLTARQLIEHHSSVPACAKCHVKIDPYGFSLERFDAIGRLQPEPVDTRTKLENGREIEGLNGLREHLLKDRQQDLVRQFCRKLLGFALGRELQLSDEVLVEKMSRQLQNEGFRFNVAVEQIVLSDPFRKVRGLEQTSVEP